jgi:hypothetical protein
MSLMDGVWEIVRNLTYILPHMSLRGMYLKKKKDLKSG